jgi:hypothetical protein
MSKHTGKDNNRAEMSDVPKALQFYYYIKNTGQVSFGKRPRMTKGAKILMTGILIPIQIYKDRSPSISTAPVDYKMDYDTDKYSYEMVVSLLPHIQQRLTLYAKRKVKITV